MCLLTKTCLKPRLNHSNSRFKKLRMTSYECCNRVNQIPLLVLLHSDFLSTPASSRAAALYLTLTSDLSLSSKMKSSPLVFIALGLLSSILSHTKRLLPFTFYFFGLCFHIWHLFHDALTSGH